MWKRKFTKKIKFLLFFLAAFMVLIVNACSHNSAQPESQERAVTKTSVETKVVEDAFGSVEIPLNPQRIVVLEDHTLLDPILALGIKPVGVVSCDPFCLESFRGIPNDLVANIPDIGTSAMEPSLEKLVSLNPDLIVSNEFNEAIYDQLSAIAPTVLIDYSSMMNFKERLQYFAQLFDKEERATTLLAQYKDRIQQLQQELGERLETAIVSILYFHDAQIFVSGLGSSTHSQILNDVGLQLTQAHQTLETPWAPLSIEALPDYDADYLFLITSDESLSFLDKPVWSTLEAVQNNQVYAVKWDIGGPIGANRVIDDLHKYLVDNS
ncbi:MAG: iron-siderophore ABC transporter substrate-binding protein [Cyanobacteria bacterium J06636_16]